MLSWFGAQLVRCSVASMLHGGMPPFCTYTTSRFAARYSGRVVCVGDDGGLGFGVWGLGFGGWDLGVGVWGRVL